MKVFKLDEDAYLPTINYLGDAGIDFYALHDYVIKRNYKAVIRTGIGILIPDGYVGILKPKGRDDYMIGSGVIESNYIGEILFKILNHYPVEWIIRKGDAIGQMIILKNLTPTGIEEIEKETVADTNRGESGGITEQIVSPEYVAEYKEITKWD